MKDLSLHILDVAQNSVTAGCKRLELGVRERGGVLTITIADDGRGMSPEFLATVTDPFTTTRTTRKVGLGLPLFRMAAEQTGGGLSIESAMGVGTTVTARFRTDNIDCPPAGDIGGVVSLLVQGAPDIRLVYTRACETGEFVFDTDEVRAVLGEGISLGEAEIALWIKDYIAEGEASIL